MQEKTKSKLASMTATATNHHFSAHSQCPQLPIATHSGPRDTLRVEKAVDGSGALLFDRSPVLNVHKGGAHD
jgi:hypothetical protein